MVSVKANGIIEDDLGYGFEGALQRCSITEVLNRVDALNREKCGIIKADREKIEDIRKRLNTLVWDIAKGNDDELKEMSNYQVLAEAELDGHLSAPLDNQEITR